MAATPRDIGDVIRQLGANDFHELFQALSIKDADIEKEEKNADSTHPDLKARSVFNFWRKLNADKASCQAILDALELCGNIEAKENLEDIWEGKDHAITPIADFYDVIKSLSPDKHHKLYDVLHISRQDVDKAEASASTNDTEQKAKAVLRCWKKRNGKRASLDELRKAKTICSKAGSEVNTQDTSKVDFDLESVKKQLKEEYKETRSKLPLLPGMPEEFARMEDIFVDLQIIKEDKIPSGVIAKELPSYGDLVCIKSKNKTKNENGEEQNELVKRILVRGKPGAGKSTTVSKLAYDWACNKQDSPVSNFHLLFAITVNKVDTDTDIIDIIRSQLLPKVSRQGLEDYMQSNASFIALVFDGYDEATDSFRKCSDVRNILCSKWLAEACVIVTSRTNHTGKFQSNYGSYVQAEVKGFSVDGQKRYVRKFMQVRQETTGDNATDEDASHATSSNHTTAVTKFLENVNRSSHLRQLSFIPIILSMLCLLWVSDGILPSTVTALYNEVILHLAKHRYAKKTMGDLDEHSIKASTYDIVNDIGDVALNGLFNDRLVFQASEFGTFQVQLEEACKLGLVTKERQRSRLTVVYSVQFIHKTFQEMCAAYYWGQLVEKDRDKFKSFLLHIRSENIFEMEYLLRFVCGLSIKAAESVLPHIVQIMCEHKRLKDQHGDVCSIFKNDCQQLPVFLLYESEMNSTDGETSHQLHTLLKPLFGHIGLDDRMLRRQSSSEFDNVCDHYTTLQHTSINADAPKHPTWLDYVKLVKVISLSDEGQEANLLCAMPSVSAVHFNSYQGSRPVIAIFLSVLKSNRFSPSSLSELNFDSIQCDANQFLMTLSCTPSLVKLVLLKVALSGELSCAPFPSALKELRIIKMFYSPNARKAIMKVFDMIAQHFIGQCNYSQQSTTVKACSIPIETIDMFANGLDLDDSVIIGKAIRYTPNLRRLLLRYNKMTPSGFKNVFDGLIAAGEIQLKHKSGTQQDGLSIEELDLFDSEIGDSVGKLAQAFRYMTRLRFLRLSLTNMNPTQWDVLFDGFIAAGKEQARYGEMTSSGPQGNSTVIGAGEIQLKHKSGTQPDGLSIEELNLDYIKIGDSVGKLAQAFRYLTRLRCLQMFATEMSPAQWAVLFDGFIAAGKEQAKYGEMCHTQGYSTIVAASEIQSKHKSGTHSDGLSIEELDLYRGKFDDSVGKLAQAFRYMTRLRCLRLYSTKLDPEQWAVLFDGFIAAGKEQSKYGEMTSSGTQGNSTIIAAGEIQLKHKSGTQPNGLSIEELDLFNSKIGDSVGELAQAFMYMTRLRCLQLDGTNMNPAQWAVLFDGFIAAGKEQARYGEMTSSGTQGNSTTTSQHGLNIETLTLRCNTLGESVVKLVEALRYMPRLTTLDLYQCHLEENKRKLITKVLKDYNRAFANSASETSWSMLPGVCFDYGGATDKHGGSLTTLQRNK